MWLPEPSDSHKFGPFLNLVPFISLVRFLSLIFMNSLQIIYIFFSSTTKNINYNKIRQKPFCFQKKKQNLMSQVPNKYENLILTCLQYSLNISAHICSNFKILDIFQQPTEWAVRKWSSCLLKVL